MRQVFTVCFVVALLLGCKTAAAQECPFNGYAFKGIECDVLAEVKKGQEGSFSPFKRRMAVIDVCTALGGTIDQMNEFVQDDRKTLFRTTDGYGCLAPGETVWPSGNPAAFLVKRKPDTQQATR